MANIFDSMRRSKTEAGESPLDIFFMDGLPNHGLGDAWCITALQSIVKKAFQDLLKRSCRKSFPEQLCISHGVIIWNKSFLLHL